MADSQRHKHGGPGSRKQQQQPSRLQMRAPSSLQVNRSCDWNVAIPLLSPLASSPPPVKLGAPATEREEARQQQRQQGAEPEKVVFKKWQHPAAPFCYEPPSVAPPFFRCV
ncbi:uncharacterized protein At4g14450, chloroplastic-like [Neltuma alba]|uniref:uncharacterized protein At4g14450, chloroplastic-like n=1 Tax=Neltuma alba TaxID=207710 RepID=UPI0010A2EB99|nr:uncharacterized protein At4g14450, chloroplastic-like [Prosopis alba]XP_028780657.1 uncharacterized protein At4g14450, chloroplastic-like [Prosopis alba]